MENKEDLLGCVTHAYQGLGTSLLTLYFTTNRVLVARVTGLGTMVAGGALVTAAVVDQKSGQLKAMPPESILLSDSRNFAIPYSEILQMHVKRPSTFRGGKVVILTTKGEQKFSITNKGLLNLGERGFDFLSRLSSLLGNRLVVEG